VKFLLLLVRWGLPLGLLAGGVVLLVFYDIEGVGEALVAASVCVWISNLMFRFSFSDVSDRDRDERAREYFDEHGHWPDESPG
jgi:hypothetical protein